jgi:hypothetical protein
MVLAARTLLGVAAAIAVIFIGRDDRWQQPDILAMQVALLVATVYLLWPWLGRTR